MLLNTKVEGIKDSAQPNLTLLLVFSIHCLLKTFIGDKPLKYLFVYGYTLSSVYYVQVCARILYKYISIK